jgi:hypothetical protein
MAADTRSGDTRWPERGCYPSILDSEVSLSEELQALVPAELRPTRLPEAVFWAMAAP